MVGFEADRAWPAASRIRVTIAKGLKDLKGHELAADVAWTFQTPAVELLDMPGYNPDAGPVELKPTIGFSSNVPLDRASLESHASVRPHDSANAPAIPLVVPPDTAKATASPTAMPEEQFDPAARNAQYVLVPSQELAKGTLYDIVIEPGVMPKAGNRPSETSFHGQLKTYDALQFRGMQITEGRSRFTTGQPKLAFTTPIDEKSLSALTLSPACQPLDHGTSAAAPIRPKATVMKSCSISPVSRIIANVRP